MIIQEDSIKVNKKGDRYTLSFGTSRRLYIDGQWKETPQSFDFRYQLGAAIKSHVNHHPNIRFSLDLGTEHGLSPKCIGELEDFLDRHAMVEIGTRILSDLKPLTRLQKVASE